MNGAAYKTTKLLGTPLGCWTYDSLTKQLMAGNPKGWPATVIDFSNTQIVTLRRHDSDFREITEHVTHFVPDGMPLIWLMNCKGAGLKDRVYGPTFFKLFFQSSPIHLKHYFLGGTELLLDRLKKNLLTLNPELNIVGMRSGYFPIEDEMSILNEIKGCDPDIVWIGMGTPKQQAWSARNYKYLFGCVILHVGFAFDVNAGLKPDAPLWMQRMGLTWLFRLASEPGRLMGRYLKYNTLFIAYLIKDFLVEKVLKNRGS